MFLRRARGLSDFLVASLCLWAAGYHTPPGALLRSVGGKLAGVKSSARPLLAYYSGGVYEAEELAPPPGPPPALVGPETPPSEALAHGAWTTYSRLPLPERRAGSELAERYGLGRLGPEETIKLLRRLAAELGSEEAAVLSLFSGLEPARYAAGRASAEGTPLTLGQLSRQLPPGYAEEVARASEALVIGTAYSLSWPVPAWAPITSPFGPRLHPTLGVRKVHPGVDLGVPLGTEVRAVAEGVVRRASEDAVNGKVLVIDHGRGVTTAYCHNSELLVFAGERVVRGAVVARSGSTGRSTGPHLHYQLELGSRPTNPLSFRSRAVVDGRPSDRHSSQAEANATEL